jgi:serine/threonine-protein kinase
MAKAGNEVLIERELLDRILASRTFAPSERMSRFLRFAVEEALEGRADQLKEYRIALEVFDKDASFDPRIDPIVRVEARRLRAKLKRYYENEGRDDAVRIEFPTGSYAPVFHERLAVPAGPGERTIAVLPFENRSASTEDEYFSDGLTDELIHALTQVDGLRVVARASAFQFKGRGGDLREVGEKLGVTAVLEGSVRRAGNRLRITARLVNVADGCYLWSETFEREMRDLFAIQDEISQSIVETLRIRLAGQGTAPAVAQRRSGDLEVYHLYLKGRHHWLQRTKDGLEKSIRHFDQAIDRDPSYAPAWAGLAYSWSMLGGYGIAPAKQVMPRAKQAALRALELNPDSSDAETSLAYVLATYDWKWDEAGRHYRRALDLNPHDSDTLHWYGYDYLAPLGRLDEAQEAIEEALRADPLCLIINYSLGALWLMRREYDRAIEHFHKTLALDPNFFKVYMGLGRAYVLKKMYAEAVDCFRKGQALSGGYTSGGLGQAYALAGDRERAKQMLRRLLEASKKTYVQSIAIALVYMGLGDQDRALQWLERACRDRETPMVYVKTYPAYDPVREHPRFQALLRRMGLS